MEIPHHLHVFRTPTNPFPKLPIKIKTNLVNCTRFLFVFILHAQKKNRPKADATSGNHEWQLANA